MSAKHELPRRVLWTRFLEQLATNLGPGTVVVSPKRIVAWRSGAALNRVELFRWAWPDARFPRAPRVTRIALNTHAFTPSKALLRRFGFDVHARPWRIDGLRLEWTVLGEELLAFADWLQLWIRGRLDSSVAIPLPPHPSHVFGEGLRTTNYAWTVAAWDAYSRSHRQDPKLPWYAIHARDVVAAAAPRAEPASA